MEITPESRPNEGPSNTRTRRHHRRQVNILKVLHGSTTLPLSSNAIAEAPPPPCYTLLKHMSPLLILVQLKYQAKGDNDLFEQNLVAGCSFIVATCIYSLVLELTEKKARESKSSIYKMLRRAAVATGVVSAVSMVSMFLPHRVSLFVPLSTWFMLPVILSWPLLQRAYNWLCIEGIITTLRNKIWTFVNWARGRETTDEDASHSSPA